MAGSGWQVTGQVTDQVVLTNAGQAVNGVYIYFTTGNGQSGSVFVADEHYTPANVRKAIAAKARLLDEVADLAERAG